MEESTLEAAAPPDDVVAGVEPAARISKCALRRVGYDSCIARSRRWVEGGRNAAASIQDTFYRKAVPALVPGHVLQLHQVASRNGDNLFFGVCPRFGGNGRFDLAWQIRTVRALWTDIDTLLSTKARRARRQRRSTAAIDHRQFRQRRASLLVARTRLSDRRRRRSAACGNGMERRRRTGERSRESTLVENGEKVYLDQRRHVSRLSPKAEHLQDVLAGIARRVGGDHTTDCRGCFVCRARLNRKDERNGAQAGAGRTGRVRSGRVNIRSLTFEPLKSAFAGNRAGQEDRGDAVAADAEDLSIQGRQAGGADRGMRHCAGRQPVEADFSLCCFAIRNGIAKEEVWPQVQQVGKFAECGPHYFDRTWSKAEDQVGKQQLESGVGGPCKRRNKRGGRERDDDDSSGNDPGLVAAWPNRSAKDNTLPKTMGADGIDIKAESIAPAHEAFVKAEVKKLCAEMDRLAEWIHVANEAVEFIRVDSPLLCARPPATCST